MSSPAPPLPRHGRFVHRKHLTIPQEDGMQILGPVSARCDGARASCRGSKLESRAWCSARNPKVRVAQRDELRG